MDAPTKIFVFEKVPNELDSVLLKLFVGENEYEGGSLFQDVASAPFKKMVTFVNNPEEAEFILLPHTYFRAKKHTYYVESAANFAKKNNRPLLIFTTSDFTEPIDIPNSIAFRPSAYRSELLGNERVMPAFVEDLGEKFGVKYREKSSDTPSIGFSGMVGLPNWKEELRFQLKTFPSRMSLVWNHKAMYKILGLYTRRKLVQLLRRADRCTPNLQIRNSFSASTATIQGDPQKLRQEFVDTINVSDLSLVVRGHGNFSLRFFEVLSLGKVPLFIDTDSPLPLEDKINYDDFMLRVDATKINDLDNIVADFWASLSGEQYLDMQRKSRKTFEEQLRPDKFFQNFFASVK